MPAILVPILGCQICQLWTDFWSISGFQIWDHFWPQKWNLEFSPLLKIYFDPENGSVFGSKNRSIFGPKNWNPKFNIFGSTSGAKMGRLSWNPKKNRNVNPKLNPKMNFSEVPKLVPGAGARTIASYEGPPKNQFQTPGALEGHWRRTHTCLGWVSKAT